jgi:hypothetical protein
VTSSLASYGGRINARAVEGSIIVEVQGAELFDVVDDHLTSAVDVAILYRFPEGPLTPELAIHQLILPLHVGLEDVLNWLQELPTEEVQAAQAADDAT